MKRLALCLSILWILMFFAIPISSAERKTPYTMKKSAYFRKPSGYWTSAESSWYEKPFRSLGEGFRKLVTSLNDVVQKAATTPA